MLPSLAWEMLYCQAPVCHGLSYCREMNWTKYESEGIDFYFVCVSIPFLLSFPHRVSLSLSLYLFFPPSLPPHSLSHLLSLSLLLTHSLSLSHCTSPFLSSFFSQAVPAVVWCPVARKFRLEEAYFAGKHLTYASFLYVRSLVHIRLGGKTKKSQNSNLFEVGVWYLQYVSAIPFFVCLCVFLYFLVRLSFSLYLNIYIYLYTSTSTHTHTSIFLLLSICISLFVSLSPSFAEV